MDINSVFKQAMAAIDAKNQEEARNLLMTVVRADPKHEEAWLMLAWVVDDMDKALDCLDRVLTLNPNNPTAKEWREFAIREKSRQAAVAEMESEAATPPSAPDVQIYEPGDAERPVPRLGQYLLEYKFITEDQLKAALRAQRQAETSGQSKRLGDLLLEQGALTAERLEFALREQQRSFYSFFND